MPVDHPVHLETAPALPAHVRKMSAAFGFASTLVALWLLSQVMDLGKLLS